MAIYSLSLGVISRSEGHSSVGFSAHISASRHSDSRTGVVHNYTNKEGVLCSRVLVPGGSPEWASNPSTLWNQAEQFEDLLANLRFCETPNNSEKTVKSLAIKKNF